MGYRCVRCCCFVNPCVFAGQMLKHWGGFLKYVEVELDRLAEHDLLGLYIRDRRAVHDILTDWNRRAVHDILKRWNRRAVHDKLI